MNYYVRALERSGWAVKQCFDVDSALEAAETINPTVIVLDVGMPPGKRYPSQTTQQGRRTGAFLYEDLKSRHPNAIFVVLTVLTEQEASELFEGAPRLRVISKADCPPIEFARLLDGLPKAEGESNKIS